MKLKFNKDTDCWKCKRTFFDPQILGYICGIPITGEPVMAYDDGDVLCTDCMDNEIMLDKDI